jgi:hypothetical protein
VSEALVVPEDRSPAGYDDIPFTRSSVPLTSVGRTHIRMGVEAANLHRPLRRVRWRDVDPPEDQPSRFRCFCRRGRPTDASIAPGTAELETITLRIRDMGTPWTAATDWLMPS